MECPECSVKSPHAFDLGALPIKRLDIEPSIPGENIFEFLLPYSKKSVKFKFMTGRDEEEIMQTAQKQKKIGLASDTTVTTNLLYSIVSVDGVEDRARARRPTHDPLRPRVRAALPRTLHATMVRRSWCARAP
jgi:hypothetical protein